MPADSIPCEESPNGEALLSQSGWLAGWQQRKAHTITGSVGAGADYQIRIVVHRTTGADTGEDVYVGTKCKPDFGDIRFTDDSGSTLLSHWMQESDADSATFWVEIADSLDQDATVCIYYGNASAASASDGDATFLFFDDFDDEAIDSFKWDLWSSDWTESGGLVRAQQTWDGSSSYDVPCMRSSMTWDIRNTRIVCRAKFDLWTQYQWGLCITSSGETRSIFNLGNRVGSAEDAYADLNGGGYDFQSNYVASWSTDSWYLMGFECTPQGETKNRWWVESVTTSFNVLSMDSTPVWIQLGPTTFGYNEVPSSGGVDVSYDWVFMANQNGIEPAHGSWGSEQTSAATTTTTTATGTQTNPVDLMSTFIPVLGLTGLVLLVVVGGVIYSRKHRDAGPRTQPSTKPPSSVQETLPHRVPPEIPSKQVARTSPSVPTAPAVASLAPRIIERVAGGPVTREPVQVTSGFDAVGENLKLAVKVSNTGPLIVTDVHVVLNIPDAFEFERGTSRTQDLGNIAAGSFQSAIFWLRPLRCVDGEYSGSIIYVDARGDQQVVKIPPKRLVNICPMLRSTERPDEIFARLKAGSLSRNCASFEFTGNARAVLKMAESRLSGLTPVDHSEHEYEDGVYLGYSYYVGETKYSENRFAAEIQVSGTPSGGVLTLSVYSDDERILSGFFVDVMHDVRQHTEIVQERMCPVATCSKCGGNIDLSSVREDRIYKCEYCGMMGKASPWL